MEVRRILAALSYFSIFFMPFLLPAVIYFVTNDPYVRYHAKSAFLSHLIPVICLIIGIISAFGGMIGTAIFMIVILGLISLGVTVWNVYRGIKVLL